MHVLLKRIRNLIFQLICSCIFLTMIFLHYMIVRYGALKIAKLLNPQTDGWFEKMYLNIYMLQSCRIGMTPNTNQYQVTNDRIRCINDILVSDGRPDLFKTDSVNNPKSL